MSVLVIERIKDRICKLSAGEQRMFLLAFLSGTIIFSVDSAIVKKSQDARADKWEEKVSGILQGERTNNTLKQKDL